MSKYKLSKRSLSKLEGVNEPLVATVKRAIELTKVDFGVICGLRTQEEQRALVAKGASQTVRSKHLTGNAVDLMAYIDGRGCWELKMYDEIADAMKQAAQETGAKIRWGCAWHIDDIRNWHGGTMEDAMNRYIDLRRAAKASVFLDGPHFELR